MAKRLISVFLAMTMLLLSGCGVTHPEEASEATASTMAETVVPDVPEDEEDSAVVTIESLLAEGDFEKICTEIDTAEEFAQLLVASGIREGHRGALETAFTEKELYPDKIVDLACRILEEDYEELGKVTTLPDNFYFFYVKDNGKYYLYDVLRSIQMRNANNCMRGFYTSADELVQAAVLKRNGSEGKIQTWQPTVKLNAPNGDVVTGTTTCGVPTFYFAETTIPVGLGLPELTDEEIDALLEENDPRKAKDVITTLADFANYCYRGKFVFGDGLIFFSKPKAQTTSSGYQTLQMRMGQCASMSSCLRYVLDDDYEETGYVMIDKHLMAYIFCDGLYYLINPVEYVFTAYEDYRWCPAWLHHIAHDGIGTYCSANFQDIADSLYGRVIGTKVTYVYTSTGPGDWVTGPNLQSFPKGTTATHWYGPSKFKYFSFDEYDWVSQENVVDRDAIVMYPLQGKKRVTFGGIHKDPYTGEEYITKG